MALLQLSCDARLSVAPTGDVQDALRDGTFLDLLRFVEEHAPAAAAIAAKLEELRAAADWFTVAALVNAGH